MCNPGDTPDEIFTEASLMGEREGIVERRMSGGSNKQVITIASICSILSLVAGIFVSPFFINVRGVASLEATTRSINSQLEDLNETLATLQEQVTENTRQLAVGGRWTLENELMYQGHHEEEHSAIRERLAVLEYKSGIRQ